MDRIYIFDTTLRDGEQSPGASMTIQQKYELALQLAKLKADVIETGFPISSPHQFEACKYISQHVNGIAIAALARSVIKDIDAAYMSIKDAEHPRIHTFIATSPIHMKYKLQKEPDEVIEMAVDAVKYARNKTGEVEFSPEDGTRSDLDFLCRIVEKVIDAGANIINIPDTVGYAIPEEFGAFINKIMNRVPNIDKSIVSVHCHNDLGLAVANSIAAVQNGARQVEVTLNGIGERAGNAALEEFVMTLNVRKDTLPFETNIDTTQIYNSSRLLSNIIGFPIPRNKPIIGDNAFSHESGIHQDGVIKRRETYEIMTPESVGRDSSQLVLGRHSGIHGFSKRLSELGLTLNEEEIKKSYEKFLELADRKKEVFDDDLYVLVNDQIRRQTATYVLEYFNIQSGNLSVPTATIKLRSADTVYEEAAVGDGPVDAIFNAVDRVTGTRTKLIEYNVQAVTPGRKALGEVSIIIQVNGKRFVGRGASTDILEASAKAYINAINRYKALVPKNGKE